MPSTNNLMTPAVQSMTCETCKWKGTDSVISPTRFRLCNQLDMMNVVPKILNGQPFGCTAHEPKETR